MINLAKTCLIITLFGQIAYLAAIYYLSLAHPAYLVWAILYLTVAMVFLRGEAPRKLNAVDGLFLACVVWTIFSFEIGGESDGATFWSLMIPLVVLPYVIGRFIGRYFTLGDLRKVYVLAAIMLALIVFERMAHPAAFMRGDRLQVFVVNITDAAQAGAAFYIASLYGGALVIALSILNIPPAQRNVAGLGQRKWHMLAAAVSLLVLFLWGSRGALVGLIGVCVMMYAPRLRIAPMRILMLLLLICVVAIGIYYVLPPDRQEFINQIPEGLATLNKTAVCIQGETSVLAHLTYIREAFRLFGQYPLFGVGSGNFGLYWCGDRIEFMSPHSNILHALVDFGLIGMVLWLAMFWSLIRLYSRNRQTLPEPTRVLAYIFFLVWVFELLALQTAGNLYVDYQLYALTGLLTSLLTQTVPITARTGQSATAPELGVPKMALET